MIPYTAPRPNVGAMTPRQWSLWRALNLCRDASRVTSDRNGLAMLDRVAHRLYARLWADEADRPCTGWTTDDALGKDGGD